MGYIKPLVVVVYRRARMRGSMRGCARQDGSLVLSFRPTSLGLPIDGVGAECPICICICIVALMIELDLGCGMPEVQMARYDLPARAGSDHLDGLALGLGLQFEQCLFFYSYFGAHTVRGPESN